MWVVDPTRWAALTALVLAATLLALACGERSADPPDDVATKSEDGRSEEARSLKVMSANIYLGGKKDRPGLDGIARYIGSADAVFLQEVDKGSAEVLARKSDWRTSVSPRTRACG